MRARSTPILSGRRTGAGSSSRGEGKDSHANYVIDADGTDLYRLRGNPDTVIESWSPDGRQLVGSRSYGPYNNNYLSVVLNADGSGERRLLRGGDGPVWSPDRGFIAFIPERQDIVRGLVGSSGPTEAIDESSSADASRTQRTSTGTADPRRTAAVWSTPAIVSRNAWGQVVWTARSKLTSAASSACCSSFTDRASFRARRERPSLGWSVAARSCLIRPVVLGRSASFGAEHGIRGNRGRFSGVF